MDFNEKLTWGGGILTGVLFTIAFSLNWDNSAVVVAKNELHNIEIMENSSYLPLPVLFMVISIIIFIVCIQMRCYTINNKSKKLTQQYQENDNLEWKHSILVVDDQKDVVNRVVAALSGSGYDIVSLLDIPDSRIAADFEIIICDIMDVGAVGEDSISILNMINERYPYKIIIPMSQVPGAAKRLNFTEPADVVNKDKARYWEKIVDRVSTSIGEIRQYNSHWRKVENKLRDTGKSDFEIRKHKESYYFDIHKKTMYSKSPI